jgi:hypothetical protein
MYLSLHHYSDVFQEAHSPITDGLDLLISLLPVHGPLYNFQFYPILLANHVWHESPLVYIASPHMSFLKEGGTERLTKSGVSMY